ncbi:MAG: nucleotide exchange factor GrpE [Ignavibacteriae bacterium]|nr:nucleotide exchange factor GrpE [Ignavibacteriota bacterium]
MAEENTTQPNQEQPSELIPPKAGQEPTPVAQIPEPSEIDLLKEKISELEALANQYKDQLLRKAAEFENYKKRVESDYISIIKFSNEELILRLLPVLDDFERSLKAWKNSSSGNNAEQAKEGTAENSFIQGVELIYNKFKNILEKQGVKTFEVIGKPFDPEYHDAMMQIPKNDVPPHTVVDELEKGYMLNDKVIRHAKVIVSADAQVDSGTKSDDSEISKSTDTGVN